MANWWKRKLSLLAIPGAVALIGGGAYVTIAASPAHSVHAASYTTTSTSAEAPESGAAATPDADGPNGPNVQQGPNDQSGGADTTTK